jgi:hypothetical protein
MMQYVGWYKCPYFTKFQHCFSECTSGTYGDNCEYSCDTCVRKLCDIEDGQCTHGCIDGFNGDRCQFPGILTDCIISCQLSGMLTS